MSVKSLLEPITDKGIKNTHYFEGRLLSARDLREQEQANQRHRRNLAMLAGSGIHSGLTVDVEDAGDASNSPVVRVTGGKAVNLEGDVLELAADYVDLQLSRILQPPDPDATGFRDCSVEISETLAPSGAGLYVLLMSPSSKYEGYALKSGLQNRGIAHNCARAYVVEGIQFRLVQFDPLAMPDVSEATKALLEDVYLDTSNPVAPTDYQNLSKLQNIIAHICYGTEASKLSQTSAFETVANPLKGFDALLGKDFGLENCDIPLAMIYWTFDGIGFVDNWAVKRKIHPYKELHTQLPFNENRSHVMYEAMLFQFQDQIENLLLNNLNVSELTALSAVDYFHYLPPAGVLPQYNIDHVGFTHHHFFEHQRHKPPLYISEKQAQDVIYQSASFAPIATATEKLVWLYKTWERDFLETQGTFSKPHIIFTSGYAPYFATPRFDLSHWDYSNYISNLLGP